ncbi:MAG: molybdopterin-dependent oxidoreductase [Methanocalculus sp.]|uniref:molybdopterin-dependent oxidoreductase n=1 Tax=Methanocalculus sp. TaxID=2004547 RepID=UPI00271FC933|nr:molybdopterin-dependent oxidoreductase [Methanocalculus sp.]MDO8842280.1 molybdopterin-dependent oxidoreductase [Methanocalculus sp.]MDO9540595.1 molybdopterin-dependent oxidoreductase [Methanocalculus sp.]
MLGKYPLLWGVLITAALLICGCMSFSGSAVDDRVWNLTLIGDTEEVLSLQEIRSLPSVEGYGYGISTVGIKIGPNWYRGVPITDLIDRVGGMGPDDLVYVSAQDGYLWVYGEDQIHGEGFMTLNEDLKEIHSPGLSIILAYERDGEPIGDDWGGPLRMIIISKTEGVIVEGSSWVKWVDTIEIKRR